MVLLLSNAISVLAQIGMGGQPHSSAVLDLKSPANDKAFYPPRLTTAQRNAIASPQVGAFVYDSDKGTIFLFDGQNWLPLATTSNNNLLPIDRTASDEVALDYFGGSVAISGDYAVVGAFKKNIGSNNYQGAAYVFSRGGSNWQQYRVMDNSPTNTQNGTAVGLSNGTFIIGGPNFQDFKGKVAFGTVG